MPSDRSKPLGLAGGAYISRSPSVDAARTINLYPELTESQRGTVAATLYRVPGIASWHDTTNAAMVRGGLVYGAFLYLVVGAKVYKVTQTPTSSEITNTGGSVASVENDSKPVNMHANLAGEIFLRSGSKGYSIASDVVTQITDGDFPSSVVDAEFLDNYTCFLSAADQKLFFALNTTTAWDALDFITAEEKVNTQRALLVHRRELYVFGDLRTGIYYTTGSDPPIIPRPGGSIPYGIVAKDSRAAIGESILWLAFDEHDAKPIVIQCLGYQPKRVSDHALEEAMRGYSVTSDAIAFCERTNGHDFYWLTFPTAGKTWVLDIGNGLWHERTDWVASDFAIHPAVNHFNFAGVKLVGHKSNGKLYTLSLANTTVDGNVIAMVRRAPYIHQGRAEMYHDRVDVSAEVESGQSLAMTLTYSDDGGANFSSTITGVNARVGASGNLYEVTWTKLGKSLRQRIYQIASSSLVRSINEAFVETN